eukprot:gene33864-41774_t
MVAKCVFNVDMQNNTKSNKTADEFDAHVNSPDCAKYYRFPCPLFEAGCPHHCLDGKITKEELDSHLNCVEDVAVCFKTLFERDREKAVAMEQHAAQIAQLTAALNQSQSKSLVHSTTSALLTSSSTKVLSSSSSSTAKSHTKNQLPVTPNELHKKRRQEQDRVNERNEVAASMAISTLPQTILSNVSAEKSAAPLWSRADSSSSTVHQNVGDRGGESDAGTKK